MCLTAVPGGDTADLGPSAALSLRFSGSLTSCLPLTVPSLDCEDTSLLHF